MPLGISPFTDPQAYDVVRVDGTECPGICKVSGFKRVTEWDVKKGKGTKGGTTTLSQLPPARGTITFTLWSDFHFQAWDQIFRAAFKYDPTKKTKNAVDIYHPALAEVGVTSVVTESISPSEHQGLGLYTIEVDLLEYLPPPKKAITSTPSGSESKNSKNKSGAPDDPIADAQQKEIARLLEEAKKP